MIIREVLSLILINGIFISYIYAEQLNGSVQYDGNPMPKQPSTMIKMVADPVCGSSHKNLFTDKR